MPEVEELSGEAALPPAWLVRLAAAIDTAVPAALAVQLWFAVHSVLVREPWWAKFNIAAAPFFGDRVFYLGLGRATAVGAALLVALYSLSGIAYCFIASGRSALRAFALASVWLAVWHYCSQLFLWPRLDPAAPPYFPISATLPAHVAAAILLARFPSALCRLQPTTPESAPAPEAALPEPPPAVGHNDPPAGRAPEGNAPGAGADC